MTYLKREDIRIHH